MPHGPRLVNWTQEKLAEKVGVAHKTIYSFEKELRTPLNVSRAAIKQAFEQAGIDSCRTTGLGGKGDRGSSHIRTRRLGRELLVCANSPTSVATECQGPMETII